MIHITREEFERARRHGYAGELSVLVGPSRVTWADAGATHWQLANEDGATVLRPVVVDR